MYNFMNNPEKLNFITLKEDYLTLTIASIYLNKMFFFFFLSENSGIRETDFSVSFKLSRLLVLSNLISDMHHVMIQVFSLSLVLIEKNSDDTVEF